jgi:hypothetical protein
MKKKAYLEKLKKIVKKVNNANPVVKVKRKLKNRVKFAKQKKIRSMIPYDDKKNPAPLKKVPDDTKVVDRQGNPKPQNKKKKKKLSKAVMAKKRHYRPKN